VAGRLRQRYQWRSGQWECVLSLPGGRQATGRGRSKREAYKAARAVLYGPAGWRPAWANGGNVRLIG